MIRELLWRLLATIVTIPFVRDYLLYRAMATPYLHLQGYMDRYWLFNPYIYGDGTYIKQGWLRSRLPSVRIHHILRADTADHPHDHPWDARTIILIGAYVETYFDKHGNAIEASRIPGDTRAIRYGEYHHISHVTTGGVWTLFFTWKYMGTWGFLVNGEKVRHPDYKAKYGRV